VIDQRKAYFVWLARHKSEAEALRDVPPEVLSTLWADAWHDGGWAAISMSTELAGLVERLEAVINLYRTAEIEREAEDGSTYWRTDEQGSEYWSDEAIPQ
jgi:hypothetical protein